MSLTDKLNTLAAADKEDNPNLLSKDSTHTVLNRLFNLGETKLDGKRYEHNYHVDDGDNGPSWEYLHQKLRSMGYQHSKPREGYKGSALYTKGKDAKRSVNLTFADTDIGNAKNADEHTENVLVKQAVYCRNKQGKLDG